MLLASVRGSLTEAHPGARALCPGCAERVIAKCGDLITWHWAHEVGAKCDPWTEGETEWHRRWKRIALDFGCRIEVTFRDGDEWHRADVVRRDGVIVELQHSPLGIGEALDREQFYRRHGGLVWLWDARDTWWTRLIPDGDRWRWDNPNEAVASLGSVQFWDYSDGAGDLAEIRVVRAFRGVAYLTLADGRDAATVFDAPITLPASEQWRLSPVQCATCGALPVGRFRDGSPRYACHIGDEARHIPTAGDGVAVAVGLAA